MGSSRASAPVRLMRRHSSCAALMGALACFGAAACSTEGNEGPDAQSCAPGTSAACTGPDACPGTQICSASGKGLSVCLCKGAAAGEIGPSGGRVSFSGASITIPPGALSKPTKISLSLSSVTTPKGYEIYSPIYGFSPPGLTFAVPATVELPNLDGPSSAVVYWSSPTGNGYDPLATTLTQSSASALVTHFSKGFLGFETPTTPPPDAGHSGVESGTGLDGEPDGVVVSDSGPGLDAGTHDGGVFDASSPPDVTADSSGDDSSPSADAPPPPVDAGSDTPPPADGGSDSATCAATCYPAAPPGWMGPVAYGTYTYEFRMFNGSPNCPTGYAEPSDGYYGGAPMSAGGCSACSCSCTGECTATATVYTDSACETSCGTLTNGQCASVSSLCGSYAETSFGVPPFGTCTPNTPVPLGSGADLDEAFVDLCAPSASSEGCGSGSVCLEPAGSRGPCIYQIGSATCPATGYSSEVDIWSDASFDETCSACTCASSTGACSTPVPQIGYYDNTTCSGAETGESAPTSCVSESSFPTGTESVEFSYDASLEPPSASGGTASGGWVVSGQVTLCCWSP